MTLADGRNGPADRTVGQTFLADRNVAIHRVAERPGDPDDTVDTRVLEVFTGRAAYETLQEVTTAIEAADWSASAGAALILPRIDG